MSSRPFLSRPRRTKVYDCNYDMGERYYRPVVDGLDRKYGGGSISSAQPFINTEPLYQPSTRRSLLRDEDPDDILPRQRRPASAVLDEFDTIFDSRGRALAGAPLSVARQLVDDADLEFGASSKHSRNKARSAFREEVESRADSFSDKLKTSTSIEDDPFFKRRTLKVTSVEEAPSLTKWTTLKSARGAREIDADLGAAEARARKSRARIADLDAEMEDMALRSAARDKRSAGLRALMAEAEAIGGEQDVATVRVRAVKTEKKVTF